MLKQVKREAFIKIERRSTVARINRSGKTWKQHAAAVVKKGGTFRGASRSWNPIGGKADKRKLKALRRERDKLNQKIRKELNK